MLLQDCEKPYFFEGVEVVPYPRANQLDAYRWADVVFTHLDYTRHTINICRIVKRPVVHFMHNDTINAYTCIRDAKFSQYIVYNSNWLAAAYAAKGFTSPCTVLQPPCPAEYYRINKHPGNNEYITLINCNENKGGYQFYRIAQEMPDKKFLAVKGSYDDGGLMPDIVNKLQSLPNVKVVNHSPNVREIYEQTRILLVLSRYESWGMVATEAMSNGIPVLYCPTHGLLENVGHAGVQLPERAARKVDDRTNEILQHDGDSYDIYSVCRCIDHVDEYTYERLYNDSLNRYAELQNQQSNQLYALQQLICQAKQDFEDIRAKAGYANNRTAYFG